MGTDKINSELSIDLYPNTPNCRSGKAIWSLTNTTPLTLRIFSRTANNWLMKFSSKSSKVSEAVSIVLFRVWKDKRSAERIRKKWITRGWAHLGQNQFLAPRGSPRFKKTRLKAQQFHDFMRQQFKLQDPIHLRLLNAHTRCKGWHSEIKPASIVDSSYAPTSLLTPLVTIVVKEWVGVVVAIIVISSCWLYTNIWNNSYRLFEVW